MKQNTLKCCTMTCLGSSPSLYFFWNFIIFLLKLWYLERNCKNRNSTGPMETEIKFLSLAVKYHLLSETVLKCAYVPQVPSLIRPFVSYQLYISQSVVKIKFFFFCVCVWRWKRSVNMKDCAFNREESIQNISWTYVL